MDLCGKGISHTVTGDDDDNNTKEKGINVGMYLTLCDREQLNQ